MDYTDDVSVSKIYQAIVGTTKIDNTEMMTGDVMFELYDMIDEAPNITSPISTEMLDDDQPLREMDAKIEFISNQNLNIHYNDRHKFISETDNQVILTPNGIRSRQYERGGASCTTTDF
jgi:hypothetical protein